MKKIFFLVLSLFSSSVFAAASASSSASGSGGMSWLPKGSTPWFLVSSGPMTGTGAAKADIQFNNQVRIETGADIAIAGPLFLDFGLFYSTSAGGKMNYNYTDSAHNNVTASNVGVSESGGGLQLGLQLRLVDASFFHFMVEGGGTAEMMGFTYDMTGALNQTGSGVPQTTQNVTALGTYAEAAVDFVFGNGFGLRAQFRASKSATSTIDALNNGTKLGLVSGQASLGMVKQF